MTTTATPPKTPRAYKWELLLNQLWQGLNFFSKAAFLGLLTPLMLLRWGDGDYGMFALASSLLVSLAIMDCGVRSLTRLRLCNALVANDLAEFRSAVAEGCAAFALVAFLAFLVAVGIAAFGGWSHLLRLPPEGDFLIAMTVGLVGLFMLSVLLLEPLAAMGQVSNTKAANTLGALVAIPLVALFVYLKCSVTTATFLYFLCLTAPNLVLFSHLDSQHRFGFAELGRVSWKLLWRTLRSGGWFYTLSLIAKTHALTFVVSAISGPAEAGVFYILLRITEIVGGLGATSSDTSLASLANEAQPKKRAANFRHGYVYALIFCVHGALVLGFFTPFLIQHWLAGSAYAISPATAWAMSIFGLSGAYSKVVVNAAMGTGLVREAAIGNLAEAILVLVCGLILQIYLGLTGLFLGATGAAVALLPCTFAISKNLHESVFQTWLAPVYKQKFAFLVSLVVLAAAWWVGGIILPFLAVSAVGVLVLISLKKIHTSIA
jgi:O-antigen/teichoic acid export membrane protein